MVNSYSCLRLDIGRVILVEVYEDNDNNKQKFFEIGNDKKVPFDKLIVAQLAELIACKGNFKVLNLWKVDVDKCKLNPGSTKEDIEKLGGESMEFEYDFIKYFKEDYEPTRNKIHIVATTTEQPVTVKDAIDIVLKDIFPIDQTKQPYDMPVMERDFEKATEIITTNIVNCLKKSVAKADFEFLVSGGAPGIGKTRFGAELFNYLKEQLSNHLERHEYFETPFPEQDRWERSKLHLEYLYMDFGNSIQLNAYDYGLTPTVILGLRIAYLFFVHGKYDMTFEKFHDRLKKYRKTFNLSNVFDCIKQYLGLQSGEQLFIFMHIDEFQRIYEWDEKTARKTPEQQLFNNLIRNLSTFMVGSPYTTFVQTFLSGTAPQYIISTKKSSAVSFKFVDCPQLTFSAMLKIASHYAKKFNAEKFNAEEYEHDTYKWMLCQPFLQLLEDTGGLPRALQYLLQECFKIANNGEDFFKKIDNDKNEINFNTIFENTKGRLQNNYNIYDTIRKNEKLALELLFHCIDAIPVTREKCLDPDDKNHTIENLERDAHIILNPANKNCTEFFIKMPFFFICIYNDKLQIVNFNLAETFRVQKDMHWQDWELFVAHYDVFRTNLLIKRGMKTASVKELYRGAFGTQSTLDLVVKLKEISVVQAHEQFPCLKLTEKNPKGGKVNNCINWEKGENLVVNGTSAKWGDGFVVRATIQCKPILFIQQDKYIHSVMFTKAKLVEEHYKNLETSSKTKDVLLDIIAKYRHITIIFTTQPYDNTESIEDCLVISSDNFKEYFGPVFASRAIFAMTKDINPNFSDGDRMEKRLPNIGSVSAEKIVKGRPYTSKKHFYKKHKRAKQGIKNHDKKYPNKKIKLSFYPFDAL